MIIRALCLWLPFFLAEIYLFLPKPAAGNLLILNPTIDFLSSFLLSSDSYKQ